MATFPRSPVVGQSHPDEEVQAEQRPGEPDRDLTGLVQPGRDLRVDDRPGIRDQESQSGDRERPFHNSLPPLAHWSSPRNLAAWSRVTPWVPPSTVVPFSYSQYLP